MAKNIEDIYPLTPLQEGLLFHGILAEGSGLYLSQLTTVLAGDCDEEALRRAWETLIERHSILRTAFAWEELDRPLQVVRRRVELPWRLEDWRPLGPAEQRRRRAEVLAEERAGVELARAPVLRLALLRLADDRRELVWTFHHLLMDAWSETVVGREISALYAAYRAGGEADLPPTRPFADYVAWLGRQDAGAAEEFWRRHLAGFHSAVPLTPEGGERTISGPTHTETPCRLGRERSEALRAWARSRRVTLNVVLEGIWALILSRLSGRRDVVYGTSVSGRPADLPGVETMVGLFLNTLPARVEVDPARPLGEWMRDLQAAGAERRRFEYAPLVKIQEWSEVPSRAPLFESLLVFQNAPVEEAESLVEGSGGGEEGGAGKGLSLESLEFEGGWTNFPFTLDIEPQRNIRVTLNSDRRRLDDAWVEGVHGRIRALADALTRLGDAPIEALWQAMDEALKQEAADAEKERAAANQRKLDGLRRRSRRPRGGRTAETRR